MKFVMKLQMYIETNMQKYIFT